MSTARLRASMGHDKLMGETAQFQVTHDWEIHIERSAKKDNLEDQANWDSILQDEGSKIMDS